MGLNLVAVFRMIEKEVKSTRSLIESMNRIIAKCEKGHPHKDWMSLQALEYDALIPMRKWIKRPFEQEASSKKLAGLWFGLFNPRINGEVRADIYVCGSTRFRDDPDDNSWAVKPDWWPKQRYARSKIMAEIYRVAYRPNGLGNDAEYPLCLAYGCLLVRELLKEIKPELILNKSKKVGVAVGFDSGDFIQIGQLSQDGFSSQM